MCRSGNRTCLLQEAPCRPGGPKYDVRGERISGLVGTGGASRKPPVGVASPAEPLVPRKQCRPRQQIAIQEGWSASSG